MPITSDPFNTSRLVSLLAEVCADGDFLRTGVHFADLPPTARRPYYIMAQKFLRELYFPTPDMVARGRGLGVEDRKIIEIWQALWGALMNEADKRARLS